VWRDTGLYDGAGAARTAFAEWHRWLAMPLFRSFLWRVRGAYDGALRCPSHRPDGRWR
jgi:hypothetical protein